MAHELRGRVWVLPDAIDASLILPHHYASASGGDEEERATHIFEDWSASLAGKIEAGDLLWAGDGFGAGSSREDAARLLKTHGVRLVLATSFARIFYRNAINIGLPVVVGDPGGTGDGDQLWVNLVTGEVHNLTQDLKLKVEPVPKAIRPILTEGGLIPFIQKHGSLVP